MLQEHIWQPPVAYTFNIDIGGKVKGFFGKFQVLV
jgi:hypothetical protein